jgi:hypothetical protein
MTDDSHVNFYRPNGGPAMVIGSLVIGLGIVMIGFSIGDIFPPVFLWIGSGAIPLGLVILLVGYIVRALWFVGGDEAKRHPFR